MKRLLDVLQASTEYLASKGVDQPRLQAEQLMSHTLKCPRLQLYLRFESLLGEAELVPLRAGIRRLGAGEPLQYVLGETDFMGRRFKTDRRALIPRGDTETLVESVLACQGLWSRPHPKIADVGTGSGCVVISLAVARPDAEYLAVDISESALDLARENAALAEVTGIAFRTGDLLLPELPVSLDAVVANLPYIASDVCLTLPRHIREHEPVTALDGGADGLDLIRRLAGEAWDCLRPTGWIFLEIGFDQGARVVEFLTQRGYAQVALLQDVGSRDRVVQASKPA